MHWQVPTTIKKILIRTVFSAIMAFLGPNIKKKLTFINEPTLIFTGEKVFNFVKHRSHLLLSINSLIQFVLDLYQLISRLKERVFVRIVSAVFYTQETRCIHACTSQLVPACAVIAPRRGAKRNISDAIRANKKLAARDSPPPRARCNERTSNFTH